MTNAPTEKSVLSIVHPRTNAVLLEVVEASTRIEGTLRAS